MKLVNLSVTIAGIPELIQTFIAPFNIIRKLSTFLINNEEETLTFTLGDQKFIVPFENINMMVSEDSNVIDSHSVLEDADIRMTSYDIIETINENTDDAYFKDFYNCWEQNAHTTETITD